MDQTRAVRRQLLEMLFSAVPFVRKKIIAGIQPVVLGHEAQVLMQVHERPRGETKGTGYAL